jgi:hypothetical protein
VNTPVGSTRDFTACRRLRVARSWNRSRPRHRTGPPPPGVQHLPGPRHRKEQCAGAHFGQRMQAQLKGGDHAKSAATSTEGQNTSGS